MDEKEREGKDEGIKVTDKRRFTQEGQGRPGEGAEGGPRESAGQASAEGGFESDGAQSRAGASAGGALPQIDFSTFVLSLATSAQVHLGAIPNPASGKQEKELQLAKQTIDILGVLDEKTKGNLNDMEARLLEHVLFDLRMMYVEMSKGEGAATKDEGPKEKG